MWQDGVRHDLFGVGYAINNQNQVVGLTTKEPPRWEEFPFVTADGVEFKLNDLIPPGTGWILTRAQDINDAGQIVGEGNLHDGGRRAFLLTPINADIDNNGAVGLSDYATMSYCITGPGVAVTPECDSRDLTRDGHIDLADYWSMQLAITAP